MIAARFHSSSRNTLAQHQQPQTPKFISKNKDKHSRISRCYQNTHTDDNDDDRNEYKKFKFADKAPQTRDLRSTGAKYERMSAPILSFDDEGDIPVPKIQRGMYPKEKYHDADSKETVDNSKRPTTDGQYYRDDEISSEKATRKEKCRHCLRVVSKITFSQLGLGGLVVGYVILGGLIFDAIESRHERERLEEKVRYRQNFVEQLYALAYTEFNRVLNNTFELKYALWRGGLSRHDEKNDGWQLEVEQHIWKKHVNNELLKYFHAEEKSQYMDEQNQQSNTMQVWTFSSAMLYAATVITTIGYGNITPKTTEGKIATMIYAMIGIPLMFMCLTYTGDLLADAFISGYSKLVNFAMKRLCRGRLKVFMPVNTRRSFEQPESEDGEKRHVPIVATLAVLALYIAMGALLFAQWERWPVLDGAYFCFITFTTIGFGDLVPGKGTLNENKAGKAAMCSIFLLFGMIVMAMSFKLMQDEIISKFRSIGKRFGLIKSNNDHG